MSENSTEEKAGVFALICSFLFPIVGLIAYAVNRKTVSNSNAYLIAAGAGFALGMILKIVASAMS